jgi:hypothetical protein
VRRALPPVGWQRTVVQPWQMTTVCACEKTVVMVKQPGHLTSMKKDRGAGTRVCLFLSRGVSFEESRDCDSFVDWEEVDVFRARDMPKDMAGCGNAP